MHQNLSQSNGDVISKTKLLGQFYSLIRKSLPDVLAKYKGLYVVDVKNALTNDHSLAYISMVWHGKNLPYQKFTFDVVPAIPVEQEQLPKSTHDNLNHMSYLNDSQIYSSISQFDKKKIFVKDNKFVTLHD